MLAESIDNDLQPDILVEPGIRHINCGYTIQSKKQSEEKLTRLTIAKTDEKGNPLPGCKFQISYTDPRVGNVIINKETTSTGEAIFVNLPCNTDVTITETYAPPGYQKLPPQTVNTGSNEDGQGIRVPLVNKKGTPDTPDVPDVPDVPDTPDTPSDGGFKVKKISAADKRALRGATFEVKGIDNSYINTFTTDSFGEFTIDGEDLPLGSYQVREISAPEY